MTTLATVQGVLTLQINVAGGRAFLEIRDEGVLKYSECLDNINKIASKLLAQETRTALVCGPQKTCPECNNTGIIDTGNNELPCSCRYGDKAMFNVTGRGIVSGKELKRERG